MSVDGIVATAGGPNNDGPGREPGGGAPRLRALSAALVGLTRGPRPVAIAAIVLIALPWGGTPQYRTQLVALAVLFLVMSEADIRLTPRLQRAHRLPAAVAFRWLYLGLATVATAYATSWPMLGPALFAMVVVQAAATMPPRGVAAITLGAGCATVVAYLAVAGGWLGEASAHPGRYGLVEAVAIGFGVLSLLAASMTLRATASRRMLGRLEQTVRRLRATRDDLKRSHQQLQRWNRELHLEVDRQTRALEERNRYLSIINAVSFALAEPMDDARTLERAVRLVARLLGVRAAQAYTRPRDGRVIDLFVTVAPEDLHAPRLPEALLHSVALTGRPVSSTQPVEGVELPDLREPYRVVPLVAKGRVLGSFALIGEGTLRDDDDGRHLLLLVGREMGVALENARLYREAIEKASREEFLSEVTRLLNGSPRGERALPGVLDALLANTAASEALLVSLPDANRDVVVAGSAVADGFQECLEPLARSLTRMVLDRYSPLVMGIGGESPLSDRLAAQGLTTIAVAPVLTTRGSFASETAHDSARRSGYHRGDPAVRPTPTLAGALIVAAGADAEWDEAQTELLERVTDIVARRVQADEFVAIQQQRIRELTGLAEVARTMQSGADVERLYNGFANALQRLLPYEGLFIARLDETGSLESIPAFGARGRAAESPQVGPGDARHPWFSLRMPTLWRRGEAQPPGFVPAEARYAVVVPMRPKGQMLGLAVVLVPRPIRDDQMRIVEQAVEQLSLALDGAALYQQATERASHIQALSNLARIVASVVNLREAFSAFSEEVRWLIPFDRSVMFLLDDDEHWVEPYATYPEVHEPGESTPLVQSVAHVPILSGGAVVFGRDDGRYAHLDWDALGPEAREIAAVPVRQGGHTSAVFALVTNTSGVYGPGDLAALDEVAGLLAVTIERLRLYERAEHGARHDLLTGLPNYRYLQERLQELRHGISEPGRSAALVVDMDSLKVFNDTLGHEVGDRVIQMVARVLSDECRQEDFVARTGGDEFVVLMEDADLSAAFAVSDRVHAALRNAHLEIEGAPTRIGVSIGIAVAPDDATTTADLLHAADQAMYDAKFAGGQRTRSADDRATPLEPRPLSTRGTRLVDTVVRTLLSGATPDEMHAASLAQRWALAVANRAQLPVDVSGLRLVMAAEASARFASPRMDRDQVLARRLVVHVEDEWDGLDETVRAHIEFIVRTLLNLAWLRIAAPHGAGLSTESALEHVASLEAVAEEPAWPIIEEVVRSAADRRSERAA